MAAPAKRHPGGRPKVTAEIKPWLEISKNESVAVGAPEALLDRGYGRPMQGMDVIDKDKALIEKKISVVFVKPGERVSTNPT